MIEALTSAALPRPRFRYSPIVRAGGWTYFSGMVALDPQTGVLQPGGAGAETTRILANLSAALPDVDLTPRDLVIARIFTTRFDEFPAINAAWEAWLGAAITPPARTSAGVSALPVGASVEMEFAFFRESAP